MRNFCRGKTIIKRGKFTSYDPADPGFEANDGNWSSGGQKTRTTQNISAKTKKPQDPLKLLESSRKSLLHAIIDQVLMGREDIKIPKTTHPDLLVALTAAGTPLAWANYQIEFGTLYAKKQKKRTERELRRQHKDKTTAVALEVKLKKTLKGKHPEQYPAKPETTPEERYKSNRMALLRNLIGQMINRPGGLKLPVIDSVLMTELEVSGSPLSWLQAQPEYEATFKALYLAQKKASTHASKKLTESSRRKKKAKKQKKPKGYVQNESKAERGKPKKKSDQHYRDPYENPSQTVFPLSDVSVSFILKQLDKATDEPLDPHKIDWNVT